MAPATACRPVKRVGYSILPTAACTRAWAVCSVPLMVACSPAPVACRLEMEICELAACKLGVGGDGSKAWVAICGLEMEICKLAGDACEISCATEARLGWPMRR